MCVSWRLKAASSQSGSHSLSPENCYKMIKENDSGDPNKLYSTLHEVDGLLGELQNGMKGRKLLKDKE